LSSLVFHSVSFAYDASVDGLFSGIQFGLSEGWAGVIGENGAGKTTLLRLACRELAPRHGRMDAPRSCIYCPQRTDAAMPESPAFLISEDAEAFRIRGILGIEGDWLDRWDTLSHGERKRIQIATCVWLRPDLLAVDEPTNHLDGNAREMVLRALRTYRGIGLLVSHDRDLLDELCSHSLFVTPPSVRLRAGGYTAATEAAEAEIEAAREARRRAQETRRKLEREAHVRRARAQKAEQARSSHGIDPRDHDARAKARVARIHDSGSGQNLRQLEGRIRQAAEQAAALSTPPARALGVALHGRPSSRNVVVRLAAGSLPLGPERRLEFPDLLVQPQDRIAVTGPNGGGKSTLVRHIVTGLTLPSERVLYIPQEITASASADLLREAKHLPRERLGTAMQWISRLGSDPERVLASRVPSPGETRKLLLAMRMADEPHLILLDEPTNHMDLPSIECLESALRQTTCALVLVSHDRRFLEALATLEWSIAPVAAAGPAFRLRVRALSETIAPEKPIP
jgi:ATPase subunit of ABC transporter with duplicated ATPase domains